MHDPVIPAAAEKDHKRLGALERDGRKAVLLEAFDAVLGLVGEELNLYLLEFLLIVDERHTAARRRHSDAARELLLATHPPSPFKRSPIPAPLTTLIKPLCQNSAPAGAAPPLAVGIRISGIGPTKSGDGRGPSTTLPGWTGGIGPTKPAQGR